MIGANHICMLVSIINITSVFILNKLFYSKFTLLMCTSLAITIIATHPDVYPVIAVTVRGQYSQLYWRAFCIKRLVPGQTIPLDPVVLMNLVSAALFPC